MGAHKDSVLIHKIVADDFADATARLAGTFVASDEEKCYRQLDDDSVWMLTDYTGPTFIQINGTTYTDEQAQDAVGAMVDASLSYDDSTPSLGVVTQMSIVSDAGGLMLDGDEVTPGNNQVYGTDGSGNKVWKNDPSGGGGGRTLISSQTPTGTGTVSFTSIPGSYQKLTIEYLLRGTASAGSVSMSINFNSDTTVSDYQRILNVAFGASTVVAGGAADAIIDDSILANTAPANNASVGAIEILFYTNTNFHKIVKNLNAKRIDTSSTQMLSEYSGLVWENTAAITQIDLILSSGNFASGSIINLYGE